MQSIQKMPDLESLCLFDSCMTLGRMVYSKCPEYLTAQNILEVMDRYYIKEALVHENHARLLEDSSIGNRRLIDEIKDMPRLHPVWVLAPPKQPGKDAAREVVEEMLDAGVHAARFCMKENPFFAWWWDDLCTVLEEHRVPCFLDAGQVSTCGGLSDQDVKGIRDIALAHPELPLVISHVMGGRGLHPAMVPLIRRVKNIYLDVTGIIHYWREIAWDVGPERVIFATGAPFTDPGILVSNIQYASGLDENEKRMICGGNIRRLLGGLR